MSDSREELVSQLRTLGQSLGTLQETLDRLGEELSGVRVEAGAQIESIRGFLEGGQVGRLAGPDPAAGADVARANDAIQKIALGESQEQILEIFLQEAEAYVQRAVLFVKKGDRYQPFKSLGFSSEALEGVSIEEGDDPIARAAAQKRIIYRSEGVGEAFPWVRGAGSEPQAAVCIPLVFQDLVPVVFYGDAERAIVLDSLELLTHLTTLVLKSNYLEWLLSEGSTVVEETAAPEAPEAPASVEPIPEAAPAAEFVEMPPYEEVAEEPRPEAEPVPEMDRVFSLEEPAPPAAEAAPPAPEPPPPDDFLAQMSEEEAVEDAGTGFETPEPESKAAEAIPVPPEPSLSPEEMERLNNEARRFARLLVSEIKLYNEDAVEQGQAKGDLYERLGRDIQRSREVYEKRVDPAVAAREDHFHNELVRILARGQQSLMGPGYPGPLLK